MACSSGVGYYTISKLFLSLSSPLSRLPGTELPDVNMTHDKIYPLSRVSPFESSINSTFMPVNCCIHDLVCRPFKIEH